MTAMARRSARMIQADIFTTSYRISGRIAVPGTGLVGLLNDTTTGFLTSEDVYLSRIHEPGRITGHYETSRLVKSNVIAVMLSRREDMGPKALVRGGFSRFVSTAALIGSGAYEIRGTLEVPGKFDFSAVMVEGSHLFIALYDVTLSAVIFPDTPFHGRACLVNRNRIDLLTVAEGD